MQIQHDNALKLIPDMPDFYTFSLLCVLNFNYLFLFIRKGPGHQYKIKFCGFIVGAGKGTSHISVMDHGTDLQKAREQVIYSRWADQISKSVFAPGFFYNLWSSSIENFPLTSQGMVSYTFCLLQILMFKLFFLLLKDLFMG